MNQRDHDRALIRSTPLGVAVLGLVIVALYLPGQIEHARLSLDPAFFNSDARQHVFIHYTGADPELFATDYIAEYVSAITPVGHSGLYRALAPIIDPLTLSGLLPTLQFACFLLFMAIAAHRLGGWPATLATCALVLSAEVFLARITGGLPRNWAFPVLAAAVASIVCGRVLPAACATIAGAALYPVAGLISGMMLSLHLVLFPAHDRLAARDWSLTRRILVLVGTAAIAGVFLFPMFLDADEYGERLTASDIIEYPELGPNGRYSPGDGPPHPGIGGSMVSAYGRGLKGQHAPWFPALREWMDEDPVGSAAYWVWRVVWIGIMIASVFGVLFTARSHSPARRLLVLPAAAVIGFVASVLLSPHLYFPQRYSAYTMPIFAALAFPIGLAGVGEMLNRGGTRPWLPGATLVTALLAGLLISGGRGGGRAGLTVQIDPVDPFYLALRRLPKDSLIAGWPAGPIDSVPLVARRPALVTAETHQVLHRNYANEMRRRMRALIDAYFARSPEPIESLRDEFGVTHLVVDLRHLDGSLPWYFAPFHDWVPPAYDAMRVGGSEVLRQLDAAAIHRNGNTVILELARIDGDDVSEGHDVPSNPEP